ncbi:MAG: hypothetical protein O3A51_02620 [Verrucomicrobia bacterium]|nr:hypothetical protein [Verrucomicrobiota bacterium]
MKSKSPNKDEAVAPLALADAQELVRVFGLLFSNTLKKNWLSKTDEAETLAACFVVVDQKLKTVKDITFRIVGTQLTVNGTAMDSADPIVSAFIDNFKRQVIDNVTLQRGLTQKVLADLMEVMTADVGAIEELGGFAAALVSCGIKHVTSRNIIYKEVAEDDVIVSKEELDKATAELEQSIDVKQRVSHVADMLPNWKSRMNPALWLAWSMSSRPWHRMRRRWRIW